MPKRTASAARVRRGALSRVQAPALKGTCRVNRVTVRATALAAPNKGFTRFSPWYRGEGSPWPFQLQFSAR